MKEIQLTKGLVAIVDDKDFEELSKYKWSASHDGKSFYACRSFGYKDGKQKKIKMHRQILGDKCVGLQVDHINMNTLDNRRENLRACTKSQNMMNRGKTAKNTSGFKGAKKWHKGGFVASITVMQKVKTIGYYDTVEEAARAYDEAAKRLHGEYARLNFPE